MPAADAGNSKPWQTSILPLRPARRKTGYPAPSKGTLCRKLSHQQWQVAKKITPGAIEAISDLGTTHQQTPCHPQRRQGPSRNGSLGDFPPSWHKGVDTQTRPPSWATLCMARKPGHTRDFITQEERCSNGQDVIRHYLEPRAAFTINISCERPEHVDEYMSQGLPCVIAVPRRLRPGNSGAHLAATEFGSVQTRSTRTFSAIDACSISSAQLTWPSPSSRTEPRRKTSMQP